MKIKSIKYAGIEPVYNMSVDDYHNYVIQGNVVLKNCDALRYFCITRVLGAERFDSKDDYDELDGGINDYDDEMTGGEASADYLTYGGE